MGEIKPLGSEKLKGDAKLHRILELTYYKPTEDSKKSSEAIKESTSGVYGIVKEKDGYYVKRGLNENSLDYIGGLYMKNKNRFPSYAEAFKKMEFLIEQEKSQLLVEATKYVLRQPTTQKEAPAPMPTTDTAPPAPAAPEAPMGDVPGAEGEPVSDELPASDENAPEDDGGDFMKAIESMTGRLTEKLNSHADELKSEDIKYVVNMVLGAVPLENLEEEDMDEILAQLEGEQGEEDDEEGFPKDETADAPEDELGNNPESMGPPASDDELGETMDTLEDLVNTQYDFNEDDVDFAEPGSTEEFDDEESMSLPPDPDEGHYDYLKQTDQLKSFDDDSLGDSNTEDVVDPEEMLDFNQERRLATGNGGMSMNEEDPFNEDAERSEDEVREIDLNELTDIVHKGVKETLSKYFDQ